MIVDLSIISAKLYEKEKTVKFQNTLSFADLFSYTVTVNILSILFVVEKSASES